MKTLTKENIQFIDNYLKNSEVIFVDVRMEMVDHIASEIEERIAKGDDRTFYFIFKDYMLENKNVLLNNNRKYYKVADKKIMKKFKKRVFSLQGLVICFLINLGLNFAERFFVKDQMALIIESLRFILPLTIAIVYFMILGNRKVRYSSLERIGIYFFVMTQMLNLFFNSATIVKDNEFVFKMCLTYSVFLFIIFSQVALEFKKEYKLHYPTS